MTRVDVQGPCCEVCGATLVEGTRARTCGKACSRSLASPTDAQRRVLRAVDACSAPDSPADEWGEVFSHFDAKGDGEHDAARSLVMRNFDQSAKACRERGWIAVVEDDVGMAISLTDAGRAALVRRAS